MELTKEERDIFQELSAKYYVKYIGGVVRTLAFAFLIIPFSIMYFNTHDENLTKLYGMIFSIWAIIVLTLLFFIIVNRFDKKIKISNGFNNFGVVSSGFFNMYKYYAFKCLYSNVIIEDSNVNNYTTIDYFMDTHRIKSTLMRFNKLKDGDVFNLK